MNDYTDRLPERIPKQVVDEEGKKAYLAGYRDGTLNAGPSPQGVKDRPTSQAYLAYCYRLGYTLGSWEREEAERALRSLGGGDD